MDCKNCNTSLKETINFCPLCGAKLIRNRLTLKNIWSEINEQFISIDNKFFKTFIHLFTKPELVINGFIDGTRKKYINVIQYFAISLTLVGIQVFLMNTFFSEDMATALDFFKPLEEASKTKGNTFSTYPLGSFEEINRYQSIIYIITVPLYTLATWLVYLVIKPKKRYNFTEHLVLNLYYNAQVVIITAVVSILFLCFGFNYLLISSFVTLLIFIYFFYVLKRVFETSFWDTVLHFLLVMITFGIILIIVSVILIMITILVSNVM
ncbi:MAG: DUF3667 domain-containing protein [Psychroserpens sp.]|uniref:DUF3667 domain-containing protein n=1 Tax=Psychroserpens sp. TaxID=2020870 RepID=UPI0030035A4B